MITKSIHLYYKGKRIKSFWKKSRCGLASKLGSHYSSDCQAALTVIRSWEDLVYCLVCGASEGVTGEDHINFCSRQVHDCTNRLSGYQSRRRRCVKIAMSCLPTTLREDSQTVGNSPMRSSTRSLTNQPFKILVTPKFGI